MEQVKDLPYRRRRRRVPLLVAVLGVYMLVALLGTVIAHLDLGNTHGYDIEQHGKYFNIVRIHCSQHYFFGVSMSTPTL